jgi:photosystem II stability/assembly factor-like uncharacterized protein
MYRYLTTLLFVVLSAALDAQQWNNLGPVVPPDGAVANGQINCLAFNVQNPLKMWAGAPAGGLWVSNDGGMTWLPGATDTLAINGISDVWVNPTDSNQIVIALGDRDESASYIPQGGALYATTDGGVSWTRSGELDTNGSIVPIPNYTSSRVLRNTTTGVYVLATSAGVFTSANFPANWNTRVMREKTWDMKQRPNDPNTIYAVIGGRVYRSTNGGAAFTALNTGYPSSVAVRIQLAVAPSNSNVVYALYVLPDGTYGGLYKSTDAGTTWALRSASPNILAANIDGSGSKGVKNLSLAVSPTNENILFAGGVNIWKSVDGGVSWTQSSDFKGGTLPYVAADIHDLKFAPAPRAQYVYAATGNGVFMSSDTGRTWQNASSGLQVHQTNSASWFQKNDSLFIAAGPTGIYRYDKGNWKKLLDSSCLTAWYHATDSRIAFAATSSGRLLRSGDTANSFTDDITPPGSVPGSAVRPYIPNPRNHSTMYAVLKDLWKTTSGGASWTRTSNPFNASILSLAVSPADTNMAYLVTSDTVFYQSTNGGRDWLRKSRVPLQFPAVPRAVYCHPKDPLRACVVGGKSISMTTDGGSTWNRLVLNGNLYINSMVWKLDNCGEDLICGTSNGVWKLSAQYSFGVPEQMGSGLPNSPVQDVVLRGRFLRAATAGRGVYATFIDDAGVVPAYTQDRDSICPGDAVQFADVSENGGLSTFWRFDGGIPATSTDANPNVRFDIPGLRAVTLVASNGCGVDSIKRLSVFVIPRLKAAINVVRASVCSGDTVLLRDATIGVGGSRTWEVVDAEVISTTSVGCTVVCSKVGTVSAVLTVKNECGTTDVTKTIDVFAPPAPVRVSVVKDTLSVPESQGIQYQWYANGSMLTGGTSAQWIGRYNGTYSVRLINQGGCVVYSDTVAFTVPKDTSGGTSVDYELESATIFPHPVQGKLRVTLPENWTGGSHVEVRDMLGVVVKDEWLDIRSSTSLMELSVSGLASGLYQLRITTGGKVARAVFVKSQ